MKYSCHSRVLRWTASPTIRRFGCWTAGISATHRSSQLPLPWTICAVVDEYPGMHIPAPLEVGSANPTNIKDRSKEILTLSKINCNSSDGTSRLPVTLLFARRVGELMSDLSDNAMPKESYRFYI